MMSWRAYRIGSVSFLKFGPDRSVDVLFLLDSSLRRVACLGLNWTALIAFLSNVKPGINQLPFIAFEFSRKIL